MKIIILIDDVIGAGNVDVAIQNLESAIWDHLFAPPKTQVRTSLRNRTVVSIVPLKRKRGESNNNVPKKFTTQYGKLGPSEMLVISTLGTNTFFTSCH